MLHELFFILLGFHSDLIDEDDKMSLKRKKSKNYSTTYPTHVIHNDGDVSTMFKLKANIDFFKESEREQINLLLPLGWYHKYFNTIISTHDISWKNIIHIDQHSQHRSNNHDIDQQVSSIEVYFCAMVQGTFSITTTTTSTPIIFCTISTTACT